eukprot:762138-Hanusia_phi.AAC.2
MQSSRRKSIEHFVPEKEMKATRRKSCIITLEDEITDFGEIPHLYSHFMESVTVDDLIARSPKSRIGDTRRPWCMDEQQLSLSSSFSDKSEGSESIDRFGNFLMEGCYVFADQARNSLNRSINAQGNFVSTSAESLSESSSEVSLDVSEWEETKAAS